MSEETWDQGVVFMRHTDKKGSSYVAQHRCWNRGRFIKVQSAAALKEGGRVEIVDEADYQNSRKKSTT